MTVLLTTIEPRSRVRRQFVTRLRKRLPSPGVLTRQNNVQRRSTARKDFVECGASYYVMQYTDTTRIRIRSNNVHTITVDSIFGQLSPS